MPNLWKKIKGKFQKPWIRFYSMDAGVAEFYPLYPSQKLKRQWRINALKESYKNKSDCPVMALKETFDNLKMEDKGIKEHAATCPAITQVMDSGWILPAPADFAIRPDKEKGTFQWVTRQLFVGGKYVTSHIERQTDGMRDLVNKAQPTLGQVVKLETPWRVMAHPDIVLLQIPVSYSDDKRFSAPTGIVDPSYSYEINLQLFWHALDGDEIVTAGTPLCQWIPIPRKWLDTKEVNVVIETANDADFKSETMMDYLKTKSFIENTKLNDRIQDHKKINSLNENLKRFN